MEQEASGSGKEPRTGSPARNAGPHGGSAGRPAEALSEKARGKRPEGRRDAAPDDEEKASPPASRQPSPAGPAAPASDGQRRVSPTTQWSSSTLVNLLEMAEPSSAPRRRASPSAMPSSILRRRGGPTQAAAPRPGVVAGPGNLARPRPGLHQINQEQWPGLPVLAETSGNAYIGHYGQASDSDEDDYSDDEDDDENNDDPAPAASSRFARRSPWGSSAYQRRRPRQHVRPVTAFSLSTSEASTRDSTATGWRRDGGGYNDDGDYDDDGAAAAATRPTTDKQVCAALLHRWEAGCRRFEWAARRAGADVRADAVAARRLDEAGESLELFKSEIARFCHLYVDGFLDEGPGIFATPSEWAAREERWLRCQAAPGEDVSAELARRASAVDWAAREWARPECGEARPGGGVGRRRRSRFLSVGEWVREQDRVLAAGEHVEVQGRWRQEPRRRQVVRETRNVEEATAESAEEEEEDLYGCDDDDDETPPAAVAGESSASAARKDKRDCSSAEHDTSTKPTVGTTSNSAGPSTLPTSADDGLLTGSPNTKRPASASSRDGRKPPTPPGLATGNCSGVQTHAQSKNMPPPASAMPGTNDNTSTHNNEIPPLPHTTPRNPPTYTAAPLAPRPPSPAASEASTTSSNAAVVAVASPAQIQAVISSLERALAAVAATTAALSQDHGTRQLARARRRSVPAYRRTVAPTNAAAAALLRADVAHALRIRAAAAATACAAFRDAMAAESARLRRAGFLDSSCDLVADAARERWRSAAAAAAAAGYPDAVVMAMSGAIPLIPGLLGRGDDGGGGGGGSSSGVEDDDDDDDDDEDHEHYQDEYGEHNAAAGPGGGRRATRRACGWVRNQLLRHESRVVGYLGRFGGARAWAEGWLTALEARLDRHLRDIVPAAADGRRGEEPLGDPEAVAQLLGKVQMRARRLRRRENKKSAPRVRFNVLGRL